MEEFRLAGQEFSLLFFLDGFISCVQVKSNKA